MSKPQARSPNTLSWPKKIFFIGIMISFALLFIEAVLRVYFAFLIGPDVLWYGPAPIDEQAAVGDDAQRYRYLDERRPSAAAGYGTVPRSD